MKSRLVWKAKECAAEIYELDQAENLAGIGRRIDFLLDKNRYFCMYQDVGFLTLWGRESWMLILITGDSRGLLLCPTTLACLVGNIRREG